MEKRKHGICSMRLRQLFILFCKLSPPTRFTVGVKFSAWQHHTIKNSVDPVLFTTLLPQLNARTWLDALVGMQDHRLPFCQAIDDLCPQAGTPTQ